ncbi:MAG: phosphoribosylamine--glycine ligase [Thermoplasmata archaeon]|nr:phosphoribosylamine--glycine ligase [Thermoplasmata archaeon]
MKVLSVGGGAREHSVVEALKKSNAEIYSIMKNKNPGIAEASVEFILMDECDVDKVADWALSKGVELAFIGPEAPLGEGIVDILESKGIPCVGPSRAAAQIEISKEYARDLMKRHNIAGNVDYGVFDNLEGIRQFLDEIGRDVVVKPIGLTGGKGVKIMGEHLFSHDDVLAYCQEVLENKIGGHARVVIEEKCVGEEFTLQAFCDGKTLSPMPAVQDHKRAYEGDEGPNTGGMGSYSESDHLLPFLSKAEYDEAVGIMQKTIDAMREEGTPYKGILYGQFMLTADGMRLIEYNARFGDPESMNVLPILQDDFLEICEDIVNGSLSAGISFENKATVCKYVVPIGYGIKSQSGEKVHLDEDSIRGSGAELYYASVNEEGGQIYTTTSRSLGIVGIATSITDAEHISEEGLKYVSGNVFMRHDIGKPESIKKKVEHMESIRGSRSA